MSFFFQVPSIVSFGFSNRTSTSFIWQATQGGSYQQRYTFTGTGFTYDANGYVTGGTINSVLYEDTSNGPTLAQVESAAMTGGLAASTVGNFLNQVKTLSSQMSGWTFAMGDGEPTFTPTVITLPGFDGTSLRLTGTGFVFDTILGTVMTIEHLSSSGAVLNSLTGINQPVYVVASAFGGDGLSKVLLDGSNTMTNLSPVNFGNLDYLDQTAGIVADLQAGTVTGAQTATDTVVNYRSIDGTAFADTLYGTANQDFLHGNGGNDALFGRAGDDFLDGGRGSDTIDGGDGIDMAYYDNGHNAGGVSVNLFSGVAITVGTSEQDTLLFVEGIWGSAGNDFLVGNNVNNTFHGGTGNDQVWSFDGNDQIFGGAGDDVIVGGIGNDTMYGDDQITLPGSASGLDWVYGQDGQDTLYAGFSAVGSYDVLIGGNDNDQLYAGTGGYTYIYGGDGATGGGNDTMFVGSTGSGIVVMNDFEAGGANDTVRLQGTIFSSFAQVQAAMTFSGVINGSVLVLDGDTQVWFVGRQVSDFTAADFMFA